MDIIHLFDAWCVRGVEMFCHKVQRLTGYTNYSLYKGLVVVAVLLLFDVKTNIVLSAVSPASSIFVTMYRDLPVLYWGTILSGLMDSLCVDYRESVTFQRLKEGIANPNKLNPFRISLRFMGSVLLVLAFLFLNFVSIFDLILLASFILSGFLDACDPLPPTEGKTREWIKNFKETRAGKPAVHSAD